MNLQSLDLGAGECGGPPALIRCRLVPKCMRPQQLPGGNPRRSEPNPILGGNQPGCVKDDQIISVNEFDVPWHQSWPHNPRLSLRIVASTLYATVDAVHSADDGSFGAPLIRTHSARDWPLSIVRRNLRSQPCPCTPIAQYFALHQSITINMESQSATSLLSHHDSTKRVDRLLRSLRFR